MENQNLTQIEIKAVEICRRVQNLTNILGKDLTSDIRQNSKDLVRLYALKRHMAHLAELLPKHEVIDNRTGKSLGYLYDNDYIGGLMMATNIGVNSAIQHTEWTIGVNCKKFIL